MALNFDSDNASGRRLSLELLGEPFRTPGLDSLNQGPEKGMGSLSLAVPLTVEKVKKEYVN